MGVSGPKFHKPGEPVREFRVRCDEEMRSAVNEVAAELGISAAEAVRLCVAAHLPKLAKQVARRSASE